MRFLLDGIAVWVVCLAVIGSSPIAPLPLFFVSSPMANDETQPGLAKGDRLCGGRYSALAGVTGWALSSANPPFPDRISQTGGASKHTKRRGDFVHFAPPQRTPEIGVTGGSSPCRAESVELDGRAIGAQYIINNHDRFT